jgi:hypothetical protein
MVRPRARREKLTLLALDDRDGDAPAGAIDACKSVDLV